MGRDRPLTRKRPETDAQLRRRFYRETGLSAIQHWWDYQAWLERQGLTTTKRGPTK